MATLFVDKIDPQSGTSLEIGSSGDTITVPNGGLSGQNYPAFFAGVSTAQSLSNDSATKMEFNYEDFDTDSAYDPSTNQRFTPKNN